MLLYVSEVNYNAKYLAQLCCRFFCVLENIRRKFANVVAPTCRWNYEVIRAL